MEPSPDLTTLFQRALSGDQAAAEEIVRNHGHGMLEAIRFRLKERLRRDFDSNDFAQAAWVALLESPNDKARFDDPKALGAFLALLGERQVQATARRENAQKRGGKRRRSIDSEFAEAGAVADDDPTASQQAVAAETWQRLVENLSDRDRRIVELRYLGHTNVEIGETLGISEATVRYVLEKLAEKARNLK